MPEKLLQWRSSLVAFMTTETGQRKVSPTRPTYLPIITKVSFHDMLSLGPLSGRHDNRANET